MTDTETLTKLEKQREKHVTRIFWVGLEIAILFAVPLAIAVVLGIAVGGWVKWVSLAVAFVLSWSLMIWRYRKMARVMEGLDEQIKMLREQLNIQPKPEHKYPDEIEKEEEK